MKSEELRKFIMKKYLVIVWFVILVSSAFAQEKSPIRLGIIGTDTSHVPAFTKMLNDPSLADHVPGARVVAAFKGGSPDVESSRTRVDKFAAEIQEKWGVELVNSIEELCQKVDAVLIESVDGRPHLEQIKPVLKAKKPVFIDKPFAGSLRDAKEIVRLAREAGVPFFSSSSLRFVPDVQGLKANPALGDLIGAIAYSPSSLEPHHPDLFWYGIHGVEMLFTLMGTGCESVSRTHTNGTDVVTGRWKDGRIGTFRGIRDGKQTYGAIAFGSKSVITKEPKTSYRELVVEIVKFFQTGVPPITPEETLEIMAFMEAADVSKKKNGAPVMLKEVLGY
jgi:Oxidoreductase family, NAD-binding Rossmann fold